MVLQEISTTSLQPSKGSDRKVPFPRAQQQLAHAGIELALPQLLSSILMHLAMLLNSWIYFYNYLFYY